MSAPDTTGPAPENGSTDDSASFQNFYDNLSSQGAWIQSSDYGYVWQPNVTDPNWAPYTEGSWAYSDDGWTWVSSEPWGWATYHYGRWVNLDQVGWCWVPGYTWAPAWVSWRYGGGYCGWAPLPPDSFVGVDYESDDYALTVGFHIGGDCDSFYGIGAGCYNFLPTYCLGYRSYHGRYVNRCNNYWIVNRTTNVTSINVARPGGGRGAPGFAGNLRNVTTGGPSLSQVNAVTQSPVPKVKIVRSPQPGGGTLTNDSLALYAPRVNAASSPELKPAHVSQMVDHATINRGIDVTRPLAVNPRLAPPTPSASEIQRAQLAQFSAPPHAKVVTSESQISPILQAPLTSLAPAGAARPTQAGRTNPYPTTAYPSMESTPDRTVTRVYPGATENRSVAEEPRTTYPPGTSSAPSVYHAPSAPSGETTPYPARPVEPSSPAPTVNRPIAYPSAPSMHSGPAMPSGNNAAPRGGGSPSGNGNQGQNR